MGGITEYFPIFSAQVQFDEISVTEDKINIYLNWESVRYKKLLKVITLNVTMPNPQILLRGSFFKFPKKDPSC